MIQKTKLKISLAERSSIGKLIIAQQPEISYAAALAQVQRLKKISITGPSSKKSRGC